MEKIKRIICTAIFAVVFAQGSMAFAYYDDSTVDHPTNYYYEDDNVKVKIEEGVFNNPKEDMTEKDKDKVLPAGTNYWIAIVQEKTKNTTIHRSVSNIDFPELVDYSDKEKKINDIIKKKKKKQTTKKKNKKKKKKK